MTTGTAPRLLRAAVLVAAAIAFLGIDSLHTATALGKKPAAAKTTRAHASETVSRKHSRKSARVSRSKKSKKSTARKKEAASPQGAPFPRAEDPNRVTFPSGDQVDLVATWVPVPGILAAPAVLLVHAFSRDRREWESFIPLFTQRGMAVLTIDLRGHGESTHQQGKSGKINVTPSLLKNPNGFPRDVEAACAWLRARSPALGVIGFQAGGNLAILATANSWADAAVAVSASTENLALLAGTRPSAPKGTLLLASENDPGRADSARKLDQLGQEPKKAVIFRGAAHGRALFDSEPEARKAALDWLAERLHAVPPPPPTPTPTAVPTAVPEATPAPAPTPALLPR